MTAMVGKIAARSYSRGNLGGSAAQRAYANSDPRVGSVHRSITNTAARAWPGDRFNDVCRE